MSAPSVYFSSTLEDLKEYRAAVFQTLEKAGFQVGRMEGYAASDERPLDVCLKDVECRDIYVGILAWRYGYIPPIDHGNPANLSITECEYRHAVENRESRRFGTLWRTVLLILANSNEISISALAVHANSEIRPVIQAGDSEHSWKAFRICPYLLGAPLNSDSVVFRSSHRSQMNCMTGDATTDSGD